MFVIVVYDMRDGRTQYPRRICKRYLHHIQDSVFEGNISEGSLKRLSNELESIAKPDESIIIYQMSTEKIVKRNAIGEDPTNEQQFL